MATVIQLLLLVFLAFLCIIHGGSALICTASNLSVTQRGTGEVVQGNPEYEVVVSNNCICSQSSILLRCRGFNSTLPVDPTIFRPAGDGLNCIVEDSLPVFQDDPVKFKYAWDTKFDLAVAGSILNCS